MALPVVVPGLESHFFRSRFLSGNPLRRGLNVAELAKSFGLPSNSPKAYAASATKALALELN